MAHALPTIIREPMARTIFRPIAAYKLRTKLIITSPTRVKVMNKPICASGTTKADRKGTKARIRDKSYASESSHPIKTGRVL